MPGAVASHQGHLLLKKESVDAFRSNGPSGNGGGARQVEDSGLNVDLGDVVKENRGLHVQSLDAREVNRVPAVEKRSIQLARKDGDGRRSNLRRCWDYRRSCSFVGGSSSRQRQRAEGIGRSGLREVCGQTVLQEWKEDAVSVWRDRVVPASTRGRHAWRRRSARRST